MQNDLTQQVDQELQSLQNTLKDRLKETQDMSDLNQQILQSSFQIEEKTKNLEETATKTKWKWFLKYAKWMLIAFGLLGCLLIIVFKMIFK